MSDEPIALKEVQLRLGVPQHVLIHLCEKGVIEPDFAETSGRGKRREFSRRNVFEFAVALALRRLELPVATIALLVRVLRSFLRAVAKADPGFLIPESLVGDGAELSLRLYDAEQLVLVIRGFAFGKPRLLSAKLSDAPPRVAKLESAPRPYQTCIEIDLSEIARRTCK
ncbi:MAG TPA: hypothetical protein VHC69_33980 [Polyangiaceae bacterium]|nr:hypothetical protein [Polyangiaceae bacterium]